MQPDVSWQFRLVRLGSALGSLDSCRRSMPWQFRLMRHDGSDGRNDERLVLACDKKFLIGMVTVRNTTPFPDCCFHTTSVGVVIDGVASLGCEGSECVGVVVQEAFPYGVMGVRESLSIRDGGKESVIQFGVK